ncbi:MAG: 3-oxoacyl-ACP synthase [Bacteroidetes bacterium]|nr:3-oxoacyl-ACP synthase [Bacteroidota bacterium]
MELKSLDNKEKLYWKQRLKEYCAAIIQLRIETAKKAMQSAQDSANREEKGSAGDKHETARAMSQLEREMFAKQHHEANRELDMLQRINVDSIQNEITIGSAILTEKGIYFIATGLGLIHFEQMPVFVISPMAPITAAMKGKKTGEVFKFNNVSQQITDTF